MGSKKLVIAAAAIALSFGGLLAASAEARSPYGPTGLGSNLHRRFVIKQAVKRSNAGQPVRNRAITWYAKPYLRSNSFRRW